MCTALEQVVQQVLGSIPDGDIFFCAVLPLPVGYIIVVKVDIDIIIAIGIHYESLRCHS